ncbi:MAG: phage scaffolding protein [Peptoniphilus sp. oral taxon 375]|nr:phage scaffolding protein [Peptoniphilus sp. oral taxon 375]
MKREFLENLGLDKETIDKVMDENGKDIQREKATADQERAQKNLLDKQLKEATKTIKSYKDMDVESIKKSAEDWEDKAKGYKKEMETYKKSVELEKAVGKYGVKDIDLMVKLLNRDDLKFKDGEILGLDEQMKTLREEKDFLFISQEEDDDKGKDDRFNPYVPQDSRGGDGGQAKTPEEEIADFASKARVI